MSGMFLAWSRPGRRGVSRGAPRPLLHAHSLRALLPHVPPLPSRCRSCRPSTPPPPALAHPSTQQVPNPEFEGQTKTRLGNPEVRKIVEGVVGSGAPPRACRPGADVHAPLSLLGPSSRGSGFRMKTCLEARTCSTQTVCLRMRLHALWLNKHTHNAGLRPQRCLRRWRWSQPRSTRSWQRPCRWVARGGWGLAHAPAVRLPPRLPPRRRAGFTGTAVHAWVHTPACRALLHALLPQTRTSACLNYPPGTSAMFCRRGRRLRRLRKRGSWCAASRCW